MVLAPDQEQKCKQLQQNREVLQVMEGGHKQESLLEQYPNRVAQATEASCLPVLETRSPGSSCQAGALSEGRRGESFLLLWAPALAGDPCCSVAYRCITPSQGRLLCESSHLPPSVRISGSYFPFYKDPGRIG